MKNALLSALVVGLAAGGAQNPAGFEVASVRASRGSNMVAMDTDPAMVRYMNVTLMNLVALAYRIDQKQIRGAEWMDTDPYDVVAKLPAGTPRGQIPVLMQKLLEERFRLEVRREKQEQRVYFLVVGKNGARLKKSAVQEDQDVQQVRGEHPAIQLLPNAFSGEAMPVGALASGLARPVGTTVVDRTGLTGLFDVKLTWTPEGRTGNGPDIFTAVQEQLGLKLEAGRAPVDTLVIVRAERVPVEN